MGLLLDKVFCLKPFSHVTVSCLDLVVIFLKFDLNSHKCQRISTFSYRIHLKDSKFTDWTIQLQMISHLYKPVSKQLLVA